MNRFSMEAKRQLDVLNRHLGGVDGTGGGPYICGEEYTIADMAIFPWYGSIVFGKMYNAAKFLDVESYEHVLAWANRVMARPATVRGRKVNRPFGELDEQLHERHCRDDFETNTQDKIAARAEESQ